MARRASLRGASGGDPVLAETMRRLKVPAPVERIAYTDWLATALNREKLGSRKRIVKLECGHDEVTTNLNRCPCTKCHQMILNGEDYEGFRAPRETTPTPQGGE